MEQFEEKKVTNLTINELVRELVYCNKMKKHYYARYDEVVKEIERRSGDGEGI
jgi:hypothetical protein